MPLLLVCTQPLAQDGSCPAQAWQEVETSSPLFQLTPEQGSEIAGAILMVLAIAYVFRLVIRALSVDENSTSE